MKAKWIALAFGAAIAVAGLAKSKTTPAPDPWVAFCSPVEPTLCKVLRLSEFEALTGGRIDHDGVIRADLGDVDTIVRVAQSGEGAYVWQERRVHAFPAQCAEPRPVGHLEGADAERFRAFLSLGSQRDPAQPLSLWRLVERLEDRPKSDDCPLEVFAERLGLSRDRVIGLAAPQVLPDLWDETEATGGSLTHRTED